MAVLTLEQAADFLQITAGALAEELESGRIPGLKVAGKWRIDLGVLAELLRSAAATDARSPAGREPGAPRFPVAEGALKGEAGARITGGNGNGQAGTRGPESPFPPTPTLPPPAVAESQAAPAPEPTPVAPPGRVCAEVFSYNPSQGFGYARLPDKRVVWLDSRHLTKATPCPFPGDKVEFEMIRSKKGLEARRIQILPKGAGRQLPEASRSTAASDGSIRQIASPQPVFTAPPQPTAQISGQVSRVPASTTGTIQSQRIYQEAALARTEGRYDEARRLFRKAIEAGGGVQVYTAFFKMEKERGSRTEARRIIQQAIAQFPSHSVFYEMYGQMERGNRNYSRAEEVFRDGLGKYPNDIQLRKGLAQTLVQTGTESSLREAGEIFQWLEKRGRLNRDDGSYQRFKALQRSPRANKAYEFFQSAGMRVGIAGLRELPPHITDIVTEILTPEFRESFGLSGSFLVRCFQRTPKPIEILDLIRFLRGLGPQGVLGLQDREVVVNLSLAFLAVPSTDAVRDQVMSILSENNEAIVPLDDAIFQNTDNIVSTLRDLLGQYLGRRDLYSSTHAVSGRRFFGRERILLQLADEVNRGQFLGIYGLRKIGKTSLIYQLRDEKLRGEAVAYVDLQSSAALPMKDCAPLYWELERDLYVRLRDRSPEAAEMLRLGKVERFSDLLGGSSRAALLFGEDLRAFLDALGAGRVPGVKRLVIVLDELERILPVAGQHGTRGYLEFFGLLRGLAQTERYRGLLSSVVVAANAAISERGYWEGHENPVFALYKRFFLPPFSQEECEEMINTLGKGMSVYWSPEAVQAVFAETGGHPFLARLLCSYMAQQYPARPLHITVDMVQNQIAPFIRDEGDKLGQITELLRTNFPEEERLLERIALDEAPEELPDEAVRHLMGYQLIVEDGTGYRVTLNLLRRWLRRQAGIRE